MADTFTANIGMLIADLNDTYNFATQAEANFTLIDQYLGLVKCTSATRPSTTYGGQGIYETDTLRVAVNSGTKASPVWTYVSSNVLVYTSTTRPATNLIAGLVIYESDKDALVRWTGTVWKYSTLVVCTAATRPTTGIAAGTGIYETDTTRFLIYNGSAWEQKSFANFVCTSSTHPASPFQGLEIYETDTGLSAVYSGSNYQYGVQQLAPTQVLGTTTASITFSGIPAATRLVLYWRARMSVGGSQNIQMRIDGNTGSSYLWNQVQASSGAAAASHSAAATTFIVVGSADGATASYFGSGMQNLDGWSNSTGFMTTNGTFANFNAIGTDSSGTAGGIFLVVGPHTSLTLFPAANSFAAGSQFSLYGLM